MGKKGKRKKDHMAIEKAKVLFNEMGWTKTRIADEFGVTITTIARWLNEPDEPTTDEVENIKNEYRKRFTEEAWEIVFMGNTILKEMMKEGVSGFKNAKDVATTIGIMVDKVGVMEAKRGGAKAPASPINIMILPPQDGHTPRIIEDPIQLHDESDEILSDDSGSGERKDLLRLPENFEGSSDLPEHPMGDNSEHIQEP